MRGLPIFLSFAIIDLFFSTFLFNGQQYLSIPASLGLILLGVLAALLFVLPKVHMSKSRNTEKSKEMILWLLVVLSFILIAYEYVFSLATFSPILVLVAALMSVGGIYLLTEITGDGNKLRTYAMLLVGIIVISLVVYALVVATGAGVGKSDELAFNYYASSLFLSGQNPYSASMKPALSLYYTARPTVRLDGSIEDAYIYPAFSFISLTPVSIFSRDSILPMYGAIIFLCICSALIVYRASNKNRLALLPIGVWLFLAFVSVSLVVEYLAVSVLLLLAYVCRRKPLLCGIFAGLSASTTQLSWFALPFLLVLVLREQGRNVMYRLVVSIFAVFIVVNGYFLLLSPMKILGSLVGTFSSLPPVGATLFQLLLLAYPVTYSFSTIAMISGFFVLLLAFYLYTDSLMPLVGVVPFAIFFLSWRNISSYGLPFVPLILAMAYYNSERAKAADIVSHRKVLMSALAGFILLSAAVLVYSHDNYVQAPLQISNITLIPYAQNGVNMNILSVRMHNTAAFAVNVSFDVYSRDPASIIAISAYHGYNGIATDSYHDFPIEYSLSGINNNTLISVLAFANDSVTIANLKAAR